MDLLLVLRKMKLMVWKMKALVQINLQSLMILLSSSPTG